MSKREDWPGPEACAKDGCLATAPISGDGFRCNKKYDLRKKRSGYNPVIGKYYKEHRSAGERR